MKKKLKEFKEKISKILKFLKEAPRKCKENWPAFKEWAGSTEGIIIGTITIIILFIILMTVQSCTPQRGTILYGLCRSFLELHIPFPETINHKSVEQYRKAVRVYYTHIDGFGEYQLELVECVFRQDPEAGVQMEKAFFDHVKPATKKVRAQGKGKLFEVEQQHVDLFNKSRSPAAIMSQEPDLILPGY